jgi:hypothetical protein
VARYLSDIVPPVLACFTDQDARVRYYACEAMYNIAKVAKGEILVFFNDIFDSLCKVGIILDSLGAANLSCSSPLTRSYRSRTVQSFLIASSRTLSPSPQHLTYQS